MPDIKAIPTQYNGYLFRSRLEARWAVFFDACGVAYEYEPEGFDLGNGLYYLPDFILHGVEGRTGKDLYVEVKGQMTDSDAEKIIRFANLGGWDPCDGTQHKTPILVVGMIPPGDNIYDITAYVSGEAYSANAVYPNPFNFELIDGDNFAAHPGVNLSGKFEIFGDDSSYLCERDPIKTEHAFRLARQARFEHGEKPGRTGGHYRA